MGNRDNHPLRLARDRLKLRLKDVAATAGVSTGYVSTVENGYFPPDAAVRERLAAAVGLGSSDIWQGEALVTEPGDTAA